MKDFCRIFDSATHGQLCLILDEDEDESQVILHTQPKGLGLCKIAFCYEGEDGASAAKKARTVFERFSIEDAEQIADRIAAQYAPSSEYH